MLEHAACWHTGVRLQAQNVLVQISTCWHTSPLCYCVCSRLTSKLSVNAFCFLKGKLYHLHQNCKLRTTIRSKANWTNHCSTSLVVNGLLHLRRAWFSNLALFSSVNVVLTVIFFCRLCCDLEEFWLQKHSMISGHVNTPLLWKAVRCNWTIVCLRLHPVDGHDKSVVDMSAVSCFVVVSSSADLLVVAANLGSFQGYQVLCRTIMLVHWVLFAILQWRQSRTALMFSR